MTNSNTNADWTKINQYFNRCDIAVSHLINGKRISVELAFLSENELNPQQWMNDLSNSIRMYFYDPADDYSPEYKVSVVVREGKAIASAKHVS